MMLASMPLDFDLNYAPSTRMPLVKRFLVAPGLRILPNFAAICRAKSLILFVFTVCFITLNQ
jgi:hypothetical protein